MSKFEFLKEFLKSPHEVGSVVPSSKQLSQEIAKAVQITRCNKIVEIGPGTGSITEELLSSKPDGLKYVGVEMNEKMFELLKEKYPEQSFINASFSAYGINKNIKELKDSCSIISSVPHTFQSVTEQRDFLELAHSLLVEGGRFVIFQYLHSFYYYPAKRFRDLATKQFGMKPTITPVLKNFPPAGVICWRKGR